MADNAYKSHLTRYHWTGTQADQDAHIELLRNEIDQSFETQSLFRSMGLSEVVSVEGKSNTYRIDRLGGATVMGRASGEEIDGQRAINEKHLIVVDRATISRHTFDYQDDWTAPSIVANVSTEQGYAHAKAYDRAHITQLIKAGEWTAPASLKNTGNFYDGIRLSMTGFAAETDISAKADMIYDYAKQLRTEMVKRDLAGSLAEFKFLVSPDWYAILLEHKKLTNQLHQADKGTNNAIEASIMRLHGIDVIETPRIDGKAITNSHLGTAFNLTATQAKAGLILFHPRYTLVTVEAHGLRTHHWDEPKRFSHHLDTYSMYTVGIRRGDASGVVASD